MKNIVICCDGTGNQFGPTNTNVVKLFRALDLSDPERQVAFYDPGVGTGNPRGSSSWSGRTWSRFIGLAFGAGIFRNVADAYRYLMEVYEDGDRVFVFGFSRGAYTARALTAMLHMLGLLHPGGSNLIPYALEIFERRIPSDREKRNAHFQLAAGFKRTYSRTCPAHFVGVWDTVKTVGIWDTLKIMARWQTVLPFTHSMAGVAFGRHAISIDERRSRFRPNMWRMDERNDLQQVWFAGVHSDVGGGYREAGLSDIALQWVLKGAEHHGLVLRSDTYAGIQGDPGAEPHRSLRSFWILLGWKRRFVAGPGRWDEGSRRWRSTSPSIHESVRRRRDFERYERRFPRGTKYVDDAWDSYFEAPLDSGPRSTPTDTLASL